MLRLLPAILLGLLLIPLAGARAAEAALDEQLLAETIARAESLPRLHALIVARDGIPIVERVFRGPGLDTPVNIKSASKTIIDALVGIAIDRGMIKNVDQPILPLLRNRAPDPLDPKVATITLDHLLSMRAGLERTSGSQNYGRWVTSPNWIHYALTRPFVDEPGGEMLYSTGNTHMLSAILTDATGANTLDLVREWLAKPLGITIPAWARDPQGVYFGGNEMAVSPRALLRFGEMYRHGGTFEGKRVVPESWIRASWTPLTTDRHGVGYGYGWFIGEALGEPVFYGWGYGGQMLYVIPSLKLTIVMTSDSSLGSDASGFICALHDLVAVGFMPAVMGKGAENLPLVSACGVPADALQP